MRIFDEAKRGFHDILFPNVCLSCGGLINEPNKHICSFCLQAEFTDPNPKWENSCTNLILPEGIRFQDALWKFDKGGRVQNILHALKYRGMISLGVELGQMLGIRLKRHPLISIDKERSEWQIVPVPLHAKKLKKRGFNQARCIAEGISETTGTDILQDDSIRRIKNTTSQTGYNIHNRLKNVKNAFKVLDKESISEKRLIIVDDVFTTGATTFELAQVCLLSNAAECIILTVAQA